MVVALEQKDEISIQKQVEGYGNNVEEWILERIGADAIQIGKSCPE